MLSIKERNDYLNLVWSNMCAVDLGGYVVKGTFDGVQHSQSKPFRLGDLLSNAVRDFEWRQNSEMENNFMLVDGQLTPLTEPPILVNNFNLGPALNLVREKCELAKLVDNELYRFFTKQPLT